MSLNVAGIGPAGIDPQVAALAPSQLAERLCERGEPGLPLGIVRGDIREHANAPHSLDLLRARRERPRGRAADERDELAPFHSITLSARSTRAAGTSWPIAFAVLRLMTSSNLVGCSTGESAGFAPRRSLASCRLMASLHNGTISGPYPISPPSSAICGHWYTAGSRSARVRSK